MRFEARNQLFCYGGAAPRIEMTQWLLYQSWLFLAFLAFCGLSLKTLLSPCSQNYGHSITGTVLKQNDKDKTDETPFRYWPLCYKAAEWQCKNLASCFFLTVCYLRLQWGRLFRGRANTYSNIHLLSWNGETDSYLQSCGAILSKFTAVFLSTW